MARSPRARRRVIAAGVVIALVVAAVVAWPYVRRYTGSAPPPQFYDKVQLEPALARDYPRVLGVGHNAGNNLGTLSTALHYGADVIEIDVISARGRLVAGRNQPWGWLARQLFRGPTLAQAWDGAADASIVKLDLKQTDRGFLDDLDAFLARLMILAWTVNDSESFNQLVRLGVDGITTDNLAILQALRRPTLADLSGKTASDALRAHPDLTVAPRLFV